MNSITKKYKNRIVLNNVSFNFEPCKLYLVIGKNGSGKTTLFKLLYGLIRKFDGELNIKDCAMIPDTPAFFKNKTGSENLSYFLKNDEYLRAKCLIDYFSMNSYIDTKYKTYSQGMGKKLAIVLGLSISSSMVLLDEPTNGLDEESLEKLKELLSKQKEHKTIIVSSHDNSFISFSSIDEIVWLKEGKLCEYKNEVKNKRYYYVETNSIIDDAIEGFVEKIDEKKYVFSTLLGDETLLSKRLVEYGLVEYKIINHLIDYKEKDD